MPRHQIAAHQRESRAHVVRDIINPSADRPTGRGARAAISPEIREMIRRAVLHGGEWSIISACVSANWLDPVTRQRIEFEGFETMRGIRMLTARIQGQVHDLALAFSRTELAAMNRAMTVAAA